ncbi:MAG: iron-containing alcohol dehydrogenase [Planctomycetota bacterium]
MRFEFATASRILFGGGRIDEIGALAADLGRRAFVVVDAAALRPDGEKPPRAAHLLDRLRASGVDSVSYPVAGEPTTDTVREGVERARDAACELAIAFGGGSTIDAGKAIAALLTNAGDVLDYLEVVGRDRALTQPSAPLIAVPTTAGTGAEVTRNAVMKAPEHGVKVSLRSATMLPRVALVDPELTHSVPPDVTASTGLDALTQAIEPFVSNAANPMTDALSREAMARAARSLRRAFANGADSAAREDMAIVSLFGGLALANAKLGAVHGIAGPLGGMFPAPHGAVCACLLPHVVAANVQALRSRAPEHPALERYGEVARILTGNAQAASDDGVAWLRDLCRDLRIPSLGAYGVTKAEEAVLVEKSLAASSMRGNPIELTRDELHDVLEKARSDP